MKQTILFILMVSILGFFGFLFARITPLDDLKGPSQISVIEEPLPTPMREYQQGGFNTMAVLITDRAANWLNIAHGLKTFGIPFTLTTDYKEAIKHKVVLAYPLNWNNLLSDEGKQALKNFPQHGGTLIAAGVSSSKLNAVFGFKASTVTQSHTSVSFLNPIQYGFLDKEEQKFLIGNENDFAYNLTSYDIYDVTSKVIANFENGRPAIVEKKYPNGRAVAIGFDIGEFLAKAHALEAANWVPDSHGIDTYEPSSDIIFLWLRIIYQEAEPDAVLIGTAPFNKKFSSLLTHDIDYHKSYPRAIKYAKLEQDAHIKATYFLQTKYSTDYNDTAFFNRRAIRTLRELQNMSMELGSHSVSHSPSFYFFPLGTGREMFPSYQPMVMNIRLTKNGTVLGELRVSKFLIEQVALPNTDIVSFRAGYLLFPRTLPQALEASGYLYDSTMSGFEAKTYFPFQLVFNSQSDSNVNVYEFPVSMDEGETLNERITALNLPLMLDLGRKLERHGAVFIMLIHPNDTSKLKYEQIYIDTFGHSSWFGTLKEFGSWWVARDNVQVEVTTNGNRKLLQISAPKLISGLTLKIPPDWHLIASYPENVLYSINKNSYAFNKIQGIVKLEFSH